MSQKKINYWDQILPNLGQDPENASQSEENILDFSAATPNQEHEQHVRAILLSEEDDESSDSENKVPAKDFETFQQPQAVSENASVISADTNVQEITDTVFSANSADAADVADVAANANADDSSDSNSSADSADSDDDDFTIGWTQTPKRYTHLGLEGKVTASAVTAENVSDSEEVEETEENEAEENVFESATAECKADGNTDEEEAECECVYVSASANTTAPAEVENSVQPVDSSVSAPILSEDGSLRRTLTPIVRPAGGFGFGILDEVSDFSEEAEDSAEPTDSIPVTAAILEDPAKEVEEPCAEVINAAETQVPEGLDSWGSLAFELGLPVSLPESTQEKASGSMKTNKNTEITKSSGNSADAEKPARTERSERGSRNGGAKRSEAADGRHQPSRKKPEGREKLPFISDDDEDFVSSQSSVPAAGKSGMNEKAFEKSDRPERTSEKLDERSDRPSRRSRRDRGRRRDEEVPASDFTADIQEVAEEPVSPRRSRRRESVSEVVSEEKSNAISSMMANVVASKMTDDVKPTRRGRNFRFEEEEEEESSVSASAPFRRERARRSRRSPVEEMMPPTEFEVHDEMDDFIPLSQVASVNEEDGEEDLDVPNGARSRRRRRSQREKQDRTRSKVSVPEVAGPAKDFADEDEDHAEEKDFGSGRKRSRRNSRWTQERREVPVDDEIMSWEEPETDDENDEEEEEPRGGRRQRRSRRAPAGRNAVPRFTSDHFEEDEDHCDEDEEEHVFTMVGDDEEEVEDGEWETDFSQHDVPGWRYTIDFIVNANLKARKREPSSMANNMNRMNKRGGKRK